jgi:cytidylate kinase
MSTERRVCAICISQDDCLKRFDVKTDEEYNVICSDYTQDPKISDSQVEAMIVQAQLEKWQRDGINQNEFVITVSRQAGAGGSEIARILAQKTKMDLMAGQIIQHVAESSKMSAKVIETLDEKSVSAMESWVKSIFSSQRPSPDEYLGHLSRVMATIGKHGNAIIVGRGANYILPPETTFRVKIIAPLDYRIESMMRIRNLSREESKKYIEKRDAERIAFVRTYFQSDWLEVNPLSFDMVINTQKVGIDGAVASILVSFQEWIRISESRKTDLPAKEAVH